MTIKAESDQRFYLRFLLIGAVAMGFALYCLYDGAIGYPNQRERALAYQRLVKEDRRDEWKTVASEHGWPTAPPGEPKTEADFTVQFIMAGTTGAIGLWMFLIVWWSRGRWIEGSGSGLSSSWGQRFDFADVVSVDKRQWQKKGIARIYYQDGNRRRRFVLDDFKFKREPTDRILRKLEEAVGTDKVTGALPEAAAEMVQEEGH